MATSLSALGAFMLKYDSLAFAPKPPIFFGQAPLHVPGDGQTANYPLPPYVVLFDEGTTFDFTFVDVPVEATQLRLEVFAPALAAADAVVKGIRYDTGGYLDHLGFDFPPSLPLSGLQLMECRPGTIARTLDPNRTGTAGQVFKIVIHYTVTCQRLP